jgi:hypothetical protein
MAREMDCQRSVARLLLALAVAGASSGCARAVLPQLVVDGRVALRREQRTWRATLSARWPLDRPLRPLPPVSPSPPEIPPAVTDCVVPAVCVWERTARAQALRRLLDPGDL